MDGLKLEEGCYFRNGESFSGPRQGDCSEGFGFISKMKLKISFEKN
jgi:hypothetical protein